MKILAIDPGGTTGWAMFKIIHNPVTHEVHWQEDLTQHFKPAGQLDKVDHHAALRALLMAKKPDIVVCERYEKRNNDFSLLISVEYIGVIKEYCQHTQTPLILQGASQALIFCDNDKMRRLGLIIEPYTPWKDANAARKHLVFFLIHFNTYASIQSCLLLALKPS